MSENPKIIIDVVCEHWDMRPGAERTSDQAAIQIDEEGNIVTMKAARAESSDVASFLNAPSEGREMMAFEELEASLQREYAGRRGVEKRGIAAHAKHFCLELGLADGDRFDLERLRDLRIVDLGCGAEHHERSGEANFYPWLVRGLHLLGADVTGVDRVYPKFVDGEPAVEQWDFLQADLMQPDAIGAIADNSVDIVNARLLIGYDDRYYTSPSLNNGFCPNLDNNLYLDAERIICEHVLRILKPEGLFLINHKHLYQKVGGPLLYSLEMINGHGLARIENIQHVDKSSVNLG